MSRRMKEELRFKPREITVYTGLVFFAGVLAGMIWAALLMGVR
jgi:hypothetical protein